MPPVIAVLASILGTTGVGATLATAGSLAGAGLGIGEGIDNLVKGSPTTPATPPTLPTITPQQMQQAGQTAQVSGANTQANTGQGLSPSAQAALIDQLYGTPG